MNRYVVAAAAVALPLVVVAVAMALRGSEVSSATPTPTVPVGTISIQTEPTTSPAVIGPAPTTPKAELEDGRHFGYIKRVDFQTSTVVFDLAYLLKGEEANQAAAARGYPTPVDNDYFVVNDNRRLRTLALSSGLRILLINWERCCDTFFLADPHRFQASFHRKHFSGGNYMGPYAPYWLTVENGQVVKIQEQYQP